MKVDFSPEHLSTCMHLWRESIELRLPMKDEFKLHFIQERRGLLANFVYTANAWQMMLRCMSCDDFQSSLSLQSIRADVEAFHLWAKEELGKLDRMAAAEDESE